MSKRAPLPGVPSSMPMPVIQNFPDGYSPCTLLVREVALENGFFLVRGYALSIVLPDELGTSPSQLTNADSVHAGPVLLGIVHEVEEDLGKRVARMDRPFTSDLIGMGLLNLSMMGVSCCHSGSLTATLV